MLSGEKHWNWQGGKPHCVDCGKQLGSYTAKRCPECNWRYSSGENSSNWKGGTTPERIKEYQSAEYRLFLQTVLKRDNYTCQHCGVRTSEGKKVGLNVHHILSYAENPEFRFSPDNGITLCRNCHLNTIRGNRRPTRQDREYSVKVCQGCGKEFRMRNARKYCPECKILVCQYCGHSFEYHNGKKSQKFCSRACYGKWYSGNKRGKNNPNWKEKVDTTCLVCRRKYSVKPSLANTTKFCSRTCRDKWQSERMKGNDFGAK